jgi:hypothetical protein
MNKLGFEQKEDTKQAIPLHFDNYNHFLYLSPMNLTELNKKYEKIVIKNEDIFDQIKLPIDLKETETKTIEENTPEKGLTKEESKKDYDKESKNTKYKSNILNQLASPQQPEEKKVTSPSDFIDNLYTQTQQIIRTKFSTLEKTIAKNETHFKDKIKDFLKKFKFLIDEEKESQALKSVLSSQFNMRILEQPFKIIKKNNIYSNYPPEFNKFKKNYKALITTLRIHPCYLYKIYSKNLLSEKEFFPIIKSIFFNMYNCNFTKTSLVILCKLILKDDLKKLYEKHKNDKEKNQFILNEYSLIKRRGVEI